MSSYKNLEALVEKYIHQYQAISLVLESVQQERDEYRDLYSASHEKLEAAERERDELRERLSLVREQRDAELNKNTQLEAELARRDAAASELPSAELSRLREWVKCVEAERDKAISWHSSLLKKFDNFQAELARRDAAAVIGWTDAQELRDVEKNGCGYLFKANPISPNADPRRVIKLYTAAPPATPPAATVPDGLAAAVNRLLDSDGSRGTFSAIRRGDALAEVERLLATAPAPGGEK